jgi:hypothetical protein
MKLVELAMVQIIISMENERCFSTLVVMKSKFHNRLTTYLLIIVKLILWATCVTVLTWQILFP